MDGITMGFGIGLSGHGRYKLITEVLILDWLEVGYQHLLMLSMLVWELIMSLLQIWVHWGKLCLQLNFLNPDEEIKELLAKCSSNPDSEPRLKSLLPRIISTFAGNKSIREILEELENHQQSADTLVAEWAKDAPRA